MFFISDKLYSKLSAAVFLVFLLFASNAQAQTTKNPKPTKKTNETSVKPVSKREQAEREKAKIAEQKRRADELQKQKIQLEQKHRREQTVREQQAKKANFERGLRTQTVENISNDNAVGEDIEIRRAAINALGNRAGTIVVMEVQTGKILTIINQDWAITESFKPCSTIKLVTAIAGLNESLINGQGGIVSNSFAMNLDDALAFSNNSYFQKVGANLGSNKMISYAQMLGLGAPTGINAANESSGKLPYKNENLRIYSHGDDFQVTPLQLAVMVSAISNGGRIVVPRIPKNDFEKANFRGFYRSQINLPKENLRGVIPGMVGAASYGTASKGVSSALNVAGKTGSCIGGGSWVGLFASVAPIQNPKYAVIVITRGQAERGKFAAAVAGQIYNVLRSRFSQKDTQIIAELKPQKQTDAQTSEKLDDADSDDSDDKQTVTKGKKAGADNNKNSSERFPPVVIEVNRTKEQITRPRVVKVQ